MVSTPTLPAYFCAFAILSLHSDVLSLPLHIGGFLASRPATAQLNTSKQGILPDGSMNIMLRLMNYNQSYLPASGDREYH